MERRRGEPSLRVAALVHSASSSENADRSSGGTRRGLRQQRVDLGRISGSVFASSVARSVTNACAGPGLRGRYPRRFFNEREFPMRLIVLGACLFAAACSGQALNSPTSPTNASWGRLKQRREAARICRSAVLHLGHRGSAPFCTGDCRGYSDPPRPIHWDCNS